MMKQAIFRPRLLAALLLPLAAGAYGRTPPPRDH